jgi:hypothetical protein
LKDYYEIHELKMIVKRHSKKKVDLAAVGIMASVGVGVRSGARYNGAQLLVLHLGILLFAMSPGPKQLNV